MLESSPVIVTNVLDVDFDWYVDTMFVDHEDGAPMHDKQIMWL